MPNRTTAKRARKDLAAGKAPSTAAGEFVKEEMDHIRQGKHGARSPRQAIAIGLNQGRRAGVPLPPPKAGKAKPKTRAGTERAYVQGQSGKTVTGKPAQPAQPASSRSRRSHQAALKRESHAAASHQALSQHARQTARSRGQQTTARKAA